MGWPLLTLLLHPFKTSHMHTPRNLFYLLIVAFLSEGLPGLAQVKDSTTAKDPAVSREKTHLNLGVTYNSGMNYYGRVDSLKSRGIYPFVGVSFKSGLYLSSTFVFIDNSIASQYAATLLEGGYNFKNSNGNWAGNLSASKYFYQAGTDLVQSAVKEVVAASLTNLNKIVNVTLEADAKFSDHIDPGMQAGLDHTIRFTRVLSGKDVLVLDPSAYVYAGTQHFTQTFFQQKNLLLFPVAEQQLTKNSQEFSVLAYELSMPVVYGYKKLNFIFSPAYILPQHLLSTSGQAVASGTAENLFYLTLTVKFSF